jgi:hypothetical protein
MSFLGKNQRLILFILGCAIFLCCPKIPVVCYSTASNGYYAEFEDFAIDPNELNQFFKKFFKNFESINDLNLKDVVHVKLDFQYRDCLNNKTLEDKIYYNGILKTRIQETMDAIKKTDATLAQRIDAIQFDDVIRENHLFFNMSLVFTKYFYYKSRNEKYLKKRGSLWNPRNLLYLLYTIFIVRNNELYDLHKKNQRARNDFKISKNKFMPSKNNAFFDALVLKENYLQTLFAKVEN